jgi:hypothetical protein
MAAQNLDFKGLKSQNIDRKGVKSHSIRLSLRLHQNGLVEIQGQGWLSHRVGKLGGKLLSEWAVGGVCEISEHALNFLALSAVKGSNVAPNSTQGIPARLRILGKSQSSRCLSTGRMS